MTDGRAAPAEMLPHAYPFVLIDRIVEREKGRRIVCLKNLTINENFFKGNFREEPFMPEVLIIEAMAQASGLLLSGEKAAAWLSGISGARFMKHVVPGDRLYITSVILKDFPPLHVFEATASVGDTVIARAEITLAVTA